jgi:L-lactate utilization protein LutC
VRGELTVRACQELFMERLREYDAKVVECAPEELGATIAAQIEASGRRRFIAPSGVPNAWLVTAAWQIIGFECDIDHGLTATEIEKAEGVITACFCGVADSGTIVLHHSATEGRRVITLHSRRWILFGSRFPPGDSPTPARASASLCRLPPQPPLKRSLPTRPKSTG